MKKLFRSANFTNTFWNLLDVVIYPVVFLALTPFFISGLGENEFGLWMLVNSVLVSFQLMNFGLGAATQRNVARYRGQNSISQVVDSINTNLSLALLLMFLCLLAGGILYVSIEHFGLFNLKDADKDKAASLMMIAAFIVSLKFIEQIFQYALKGFEDFKTASRLSLLVRFSTLTSNIILVALGYDLYAMLLSHVLLSLFYLVIHLIQVKRVIQGFKLHIHWDRSNILEELRYGIYTWIQSVAVIITYQMDRFIVTSFFGLAALSYYSVVATMFNHIHMSINALVPWMLPKVARLKEAGKEVTQLFLSGRSFIVLSGIALLLTFYYLSEPVFVIWLGETVYAEMKSYIRLFVLFELFFLFTSAPYYFLNANGNEKLMTKITLISSGITLTTMFGGIYLFDSVEGMIYGLIIGTVLGISIENSLINKHLLHHSRIRESFLILLPSTFATLAIISPDIWLSFTSLIGAVLSAYFLFVKSGEFNMRVLLFG